MMRYQYAVRHWAGDFRNAIGIESKQRVAQKMSVVCPATAPDVVRVVAGSTKGIDRSGILFFRVDMLVDDIVEPGGIGLILPVKPAAPHTVPGASESG